MSREFDGSSSIGVFCAPGALAPLDGGPTTLAILWRPLEVKAQGLIIVWGGANRLAVNPYSDGFNYWSTSGGFTACQTYTATDGWRLDVYTKPDGTSGNLFSHRYLYDSPGWNHVDEATTVGDSGGTTVDFVALGQLSNGETLHGRLAAVAIWKGVLSDGDIETLHEGLSEWMALTPDACWPFNQASTSDPVLDITGGGADQTSLVGTSVSADEPAGWSYALGTAAAGVGYAGVRGAGESSKVASGVGVGRAGVRGAGEGAKVALSAGRLYVGGRGVGAGAKTGLSAGQLLAGGTGSGGSAKTSLGAGQMRAGVRGAAVSAKTVLGEGVGRVGVRGRHISTEAPLGLLGGTVTVVGLDGSVEVAGLGGTVDIV